MPGGQWLIAQYHTQLRRIDPADLAALERDTQLGRYMAEHGWSFPWLVAEHATCPLCGAGDQADGYTPVSPVPRYEPDPRFPNHRFLDKRVDREQPVKLLAWCHACQHLSLIDRALDVTIVPSEPRNFRGDLLGGDAAFYFRERDGD